jgi:hypothetical protein
MAIDGHQQPSKAIKGDRLEIVTWRVHEAVARPQSPRAVPGVALGRDCLGDCPWWRQRLAVPAIGCNQMQSDAMRCNQKVIRGIIREIIRGVIRGVIRRRFAYSTTCSSRHSGCLFIAAPRDLRAML